LACSKADLVLSLEMAAMALTSVIAARCLVGRSLLLLALAGLGLSIGGCLLSLEASTYARSWYPGSLPELELASAC